MADVFVSYASEDRERVRPLAEALESRGLSVWWDRALAAGDDYAAVIARELDAAKAVVVVWSTTSVASPWVRDEAGRARDAGRLVPAMIDAVEIPLGFGQVHTEDLTAWNGAPGAPQIDLLADAVQARIAGAPVDAAAMAAKRSRLTARVRIVSVLGAVASVVAIIAGVTTIARTSDPAPAPSPSAPAAQTEVDPLAQLLRLVDEGKITGEQAVRLAELLKQQAFADAPPSSAAPSAPTEPPRGGILRANLAPEAAAAVEIASAGFDDAARETYAEAVAQLIQDPDVRVRAAVLKASRPQSRSEGVDALLAIAAEGGPAASAIYRACGALLSAVDDPRARATLESAQRLNPQDKRIWTLLSVLYGRDRRPLDAAGAALVGEGLDSAAQGRRDEAARTLEAALPYVARNPESKAFVLGQLGDAAAARSDWDAAERRYAEAVRLHGATKDAGALAVEAAKLARAHLAQGEARDACRTLQKAQTAGAVVSEPELNAACRPPATGGVGPPGPLRLIPPGPSSTPPG